MIRGRRSCSTPWPAQRRRAALLPPVPRRSGVPGRAQRADRAARLRRRAARAVRDDPTWASAATRPRRRSGSSGTCSRTATCAGWRSPRRASTRSGPGDAEDFDRYARGWAELESGVDRRAPLSRFYSEASIASLGDGVRSFQRWGFQQDQAELVGALSDIAAGHRGARGGDPRRHHARRGGREGAVGGRAAAGVVR